MFRDRTIVERQGVCLAEGHTGAGVRSRRKRAWGQQGVLGLGRLGAASLPEAAPLAGTCRRDNRARPMGCLGALAGGASWCLSPAAAPAAGGPPSPAQPRWSTSSPAPGPRREHPESPGCWSVECTVSLLAPGLAV